MRLSCPNCGAQYEVPDDVIPSEGRDVQCSNCNTTWFQDHPDNLSTSAEDTPQPTPTEEGEQASETKHDAGDEDELAAAVANVLKRTRTTSEDVRDDTTVSDPQDEPDRDVPEFEASLDAQLAEDLEKGAEEPQEQPPVVEIETTEDQPKTERPERRQLSPEIADVLRQEAEHEAAARQAEQDVFESQPDLGLEEPQDDAAKRARQARERMAKMRGVPVETVERSAEPELSSARRDVFPDIEEINSTLRSTEDREPGEQPDGRPTQSQRRAGGRRIGFALAILAVAGGAFAYIQPETVTGAFPPSEPYVTAFINFVDNARLTLDTQLTKLLLWLDSMASEAPTDG